MAAITKAIQARRGRKKRPHVPTSTRDLVWKRDWYQCVLAIPGVCTGTAETVDHIANRGQGGSTVLNDPVCLVSACSLCNSVKEDASGELREQLLRRGLRVEKAATNEATLERCRNNIVTYPSGDRFLLTSDGRRKAVL